MLETLIGFRSAGLGAQRRNPPKSAGQRRVRRVKNAPNPPYRNTGAAEMLTAHVYEVRRDATLARMN
jgi:hypothetical protein